MVCNYSFESWITNTTATIIVSQRFFVKFIAISGDLRSPSGKNMAAILQNGGQDHLLSVDLSLMS